MKPVITLISDWRLRDPYLSMFKGELLAQMPDAFLLDITHHIDLRDIAQTAFLMRQSFMSFPKGSVHLLLTNVLFSSVFDPVVLERDGHFFIGEDNGIFTMMFGGNAPLEGRRYVGEETQSLAKMVLLAKYIFNDELNAHTAVCGPLAMKIGQSAINNVFEHRIEGRIVYVDAYFNAITNIPIQMFREVVKGENVTAEVVTNKSMWKINKCYARYESGNELFFIENPLGCMEIAVAQGKAAALADLCINDKVTIFY